MHPQESRANNSPIQPNLPHELMKDQHFSTAEKSSSMLTDIFPRFGYYVE